MRSQPAKEGRVTKGATAEKQDPVERRRLQNRLSQRNHRRKIRDRIAKLQERVIASELRAAATLNNWGYHNALATPSTDHIPQYEGSKTKTSAYPLDAASSLPSSYLLQSPSLCNCCNSALDSSQLASPETSSSLSLVNISGQTPDLTSPSTLSNSPDCSSAPTSPSTTLESSRNTSPSYIIQGLNLVMSPEASNSSNAGGPSNIYYFATEASLPQILQLLNTEPQMHKAIILIPQSLPAADMLSSVNTTAFSFDENSIETANFAPACDASTMSELSPSLNWIESPGVMCPTQPMQSFEESYLGIV